MSDIDGRAVAKALRAEVAAEAARLREEGIVPTLAVVVPTDDEGTAWYVRSIRKAAEKEGIDCRVEHLKDPGLDEIVAKLQELSADPAVHGVICQTPLPEGVTLSQVGGYISPFKDVDGANSESLGRLAAGLRNVRARDGGGGAGAAQAGGSDARGREGGRGRPVHCGGQAGGAAAAERVGDGDRVPLAHEGSRGGVPRG